MGISPYTVNAITSDSTKRSAEITVNAQVERLEWVEAQLVTVQ